LAALDVARYSLALAVRAGTEIHLHERLLLFGEAANAGGG
jgi:hypothetical protein